MELEPEIVATGHGKPMQGVTMRDQLDYLNEHFEEIAEPVHGRYVHQAAVTNKYGVASLPQKKELIPLVIKVAALVLASCAGTLLLYNRIGRKKVRKDPR